MTTRTRAVGSPDATRAVDWEQRIDFPRLREERLARAKAALEQAIAYASTLAKPQRPKGMIARIEKRLGQVGRPD